MACLILCSKLNWLKVFLPCVVESGHALVLKPSPRVGFHEMDGVYSFHHLLELLACLSPLHLAITKQVPFPPLLVLETSK